MATLHKGDDDDDNNNHYHKYHDDKHAAPDNGASSYKITYNHRPSMNVSTSVKSRYSADDLHS